MEFAGYEMPAEFKGALAEHRAVREHAGLFDVSHMGRLLLRGPDAEALLQKIATNDSGRLKPLRCHYSLICNSQGGILDDVIVFRLEAETFMVVVNAANRKKIVEWLKLHGRGLNFHIADSTNCIPMVAVQGPLAPAVMERTLGRDFSALRRMSVDAFTADGHRVLASRTGYTGEDGFEVFIFMKDSTMGFPQRLWESFLREGESFGLQPCGLIARDTLRLEAGYCLYGADIDETVTPLEAGLQFAVNFSHPFVGREALERQRAEGVKLRRVGLRALEKAIPRRGMEVYAGSERVGVVTSGGYSPTLQAGIAMAYLPTPLCTPSSHVQVNVRGRMVKFEIVNLPFYSRVNRQVGS